MKTSCISLVIAFALVVLMPISAQAEPLGTAFTYQGRLDDNSVPVTGSYDFRFMLYDAVVDGMQQGITVITENVQVTNGIFTVEIDPAGGSTDVFDGNSRWLEISLRDGASTGSFSILSPRQRLTPAPYAVYSISGEGQETANLALNLQCEECVSAAETDFYDSLFEALAPINHMHTFQDIEGIADDLECIGCISAQETDFYESLFTIFAPSVHGHFLGDLDSEGDLTVNGSIVIGTQLEVNGPIYQRGSLLHADYVFQPGYQLESIEEHASIMWENKHLPAIPMRKLDNNTREVVEIGSHQRGIVEELEKAHIYIEQLNKANNELRDRLAKLEAQLNAMKSLTVESSL